MYFPLSCSLVVQIMNPPRDSFGSHVERDEPWSLLVEAKCPRLAKKTQRGYPFVVFSVSRDRGEYKQLPVRRYEHKNLIIGADQAYFNCRA